MFLKRENYDLARRYLLFMRFADREIVSDIEYQECWKILDKKEGSTLIVDEYKKSSNYTFRKRNYEPPENYVLMEDKL